jgi:hypothetical protein
MAAIAQPTAPLVPSMPLMHSVPKSNSTKYIMIISAVVAIAAIVVYFMMSNKSESPGTKEVPEEEEPEEEPEEEVPEEEVPEEEVPEEEEPEEEVPEEEEPEEEEEEPVPAPVEEPIVVPTQRNLCVYLNSWGSCNTLCGTGEQFRRQVRYNEGDDISAMHGLDPNVVTPHECVPDDLRESRSCTGFTCGDTTYTWNTYIANNPDKSFNDYCAWIVESDACEDPVFKRQSVCKTQCSS